MCRWSLQNICQIQDSTPECQRTENVFNSVVPQTRTQHLEGRETEHNRLTADPVTAGLVISRAFFSNISQLRRLCHWFRRRMIYMTDLRRRQCWQAHTSRCSSSTGWRWKEILSEIFMKTRPNTIPEHAVRGGRSCGAAGGSFIFRPWVDPSHLLVLSLPLRHSSSLLSCKKETAGSDAAVGVCHFPSPHSCFPMSPRCQVRL